MLDRNGTPNYLNMRKDRGAAFDAERADARKALYATWEIEWVDDGTLPAMGLRYVAVHDDGREREYDDFASAMLAVWPAGTKEAAGHVDYIKPEWMREAVAVDMDMRDQSEYGVNEWQYRNPAAVSAQIEEWTQAFETAAIERHDDIH